jgi:hypothetical protein
MAGLDERGQMRFSRSPHHQEEMGENSEENEKWRKKELECRRSHQEEWREHEIQ